MKKTVINTKAALTNNTDTCKGEITMKKTVNTNKKVNKVKRTISCLMAALTVGTTAAAMLTMPSLTVNAASSSYVTERTEAKD